MQNEVNTDQIESKEKKLLKAPSIVEDIEKKLLMKSQANLEKQYDKELTQAVIELEQKKRPPFPSIPSFIVAAIVIGFTDFSDSVKCLMQKLSHNTRSYYRGHRNILETFLVKGNYVPMIKQTSFGCQFVLQSNILDNNEKLK